MAKGPQFERDFCKELSLWFSQGVRDDIFWRTAGSGAMATTRRKAGKDVRNHEGDICAIDETGQHFIRLVVLELKKGYNKALDFQAILDGAGKKPPLLMEWLLKLENERRVAGKTFTMLVIRRDRRKVILALDADLWEAIEPAVEEMEAGFTWVNVCANGLDYVFIQWEAFRNGVCPVVFMEGVSCYEK